MAITSFDKEFVVTDQQSIEKIRWDLANPRRVVIKQRNYREESERGIELLRWRLRIRPEE